MKGPHVINVKYNWINLMDLYLLLVVLILIIVVGTSLLLFDVVNFPEESFISTTLIAISTSLLLRWVYLLISEHQPRIDMPTPYLVFIEQESADYSESFMENVDLALTQSAEFVRGDINFVLQESGGLSPFFITSVKQAVSEPALSVTSSEKSEPLATLPSDSHVNQHVVTVPLLTVGVGLCLALIGLFSYSLKQMRLGQQALRDAIVFESRKSQRLENEINSLRMELRNRLAQDSVTKTVVGTGNHVVPMLGMKRRVQMD